MCIREIGKIKEIILIHFFFADVSIFLCLNRQFFTRFLEILAFFKIDISQEPKLLESCLPTQIVAKYLKKMSKAIFLGQKLYIAFYLTSKCAKNG